MNLCSACSRLWFFAILVSNGRISRGQQDFGIFSITEMEDRVRLGLFNEPALFDDEDLSFFEEGSGSGDGLPPDTIAESTNFNLAHLYNLTGDLNDVLVENVDNLKNEVFPAIDEFQIQIENATERTTRRLQCTFSRRLRESLQIMEKIFSLSVTEIAQIQLQLENGTVEKIVDPEDTTDFITTPESTTLETVDIPVDCREALEFGLQTGVNAIKPNPRSDDLKSVWCDQDTDDGGWTVILKRQPEYNQLNFNRNWDDYVNGFGEPDGEYWLGLEAMNQLTRRKSYKLRVEMEANEESAFSLYDTFRVGPSKRNYKLKVNDYNESSTGGDALSYHNGQEFTTVDADNDGASGGNCADWSGGGGFWYDFCFITNPTGIYSFSDNRDAADVYLEWREWQGHHNYLSHLIFMIKPHD